MNEYETRVDFPHSIQQHGASWGLRFSVALIMTVMGLAIGGALAYQEHGPSASKFTSESLLRIVSDPPEEALTIAAIVKSSHLLERVLQQNQNFQINGVRQEELVKQVAGWIEVTAETETIFKLRFRHKNPQMCHMVGEGVTNALVTFLRDGQEGTSEKTAAILVAARDEVSTTLSKLESEYDMFLQKRPPETPNTQLTSLQEELERLNLSSSATKADLAWIEDAEREGVPERTIVVAYERGLQNTLSAAGTELDDFETKDAELTASEILQTLRTVLMRTRQREEAIQKQLDVVAEAMKTHKAYESQREAMARVIARERDLLEEVHMKLRNVKIPESDQTVVVLSEADHGVMDKKTLHDALRLWMFVGSIVGLAAGTFVAMLI
jgi:hypothetical protein